MSWHEGNCSICGQVKEVGLVTCIEEEMCRTCFDEVNAMLPTTQTMIDNIIKPQIIRALKEEQKIAVAHLN